MGECEHDMRNDDPIYTGGEWVGVGLICTKCGFQTLTVEEYVPVDKVCPDCGTTFEGMPDADDEDCLDCFKSKLPDWIEQVKRERHA